MALVTTPVTILKSYEYSETSKILRLLTRDAGLCSVIAKGARRPRSRFGGLLEPFTDGVATFYTKETRELHTLSDFELRRERQALGRDLRRYAGAGLMTEIALRFASTNPDRDLFDRLRRGLDRLVAETEGIETAVIEESWGLIGCLGFAPSVESCPVCGRGDPRGPVSFDLAEGGIRCGDCAPTTVGATVRRLEEAARRDLCRALRGRIGDDGAQDPGLQRRLLRDFISYHLTDRRPLRSFRFLEEQLG